MPDGPSAIPPPKIGPAQPQQAPRPQRSCCNSYDDQRHEIGCPNGTAILPEELDRLPIVPLLVYVDNQRNRYEFRTHAGTMALLQEMELRDRHMVLALVMDVLECLADDLVDAASAIEVISIIQTQREAAM